jgi:predicted nucleotidyltransferase
MPFPELVQRLSGPTGSGVVAAFLFGSHAEDRAHRESDVDIGIVLDYASYPDKRTRFEQNLRLRAALASSVDGAAIDLVILNDAPPVFAAHVVTRGVPLVILDAELEHAFRRDIQLRAADLKPFLARTRAIKLAAIAR